MSETNRPAAAGANMNPACDTASAEPRHGLRPTRRDFLAFGVGAFVVAALPVAALRRKQLVRRTVPAMGTFAQLAVAHRDERYAHAALDAAVAEIERVERAMTRFDTRSEVGVANLEAARRAVPVSAATAAVLAEGLHWAAASNGRFDPCLATEAVLWDVQRRSAPPSAGELRRLAGRHPWRALELGRAGGSDVVVFHEADIGIDLGGIAKGYGVDRAATALRDWGIGSAFVNIGGDLYAIGRGVDGEAWRVGVRDPYDPGPIVTSLEVEDTAVATSGTYEHYFDHDGRRYHHLLDTETAAPRATSAASLTVLASSCMSADAAATAAFGMGRADAESLFRRVAPDVTWVV